MSKSSNIKRLLCPKNIAVVGGTEAAEVIRQSRKTGFQGEIWAVNARRSEVEGLKCFASVKDLPTAPDAAFVAIPREPAISVIKDLETMGAGGVICYASGFSETSDGQEYHTDLMKSVGDLALVGPNCYGILNYLDGAALWPDHHGGQHVDKGVAIITQSGNIGISLTMQERSLPVAYMISVGNQAVLSISDYIDALCDDDRVTAIGLHMEGVDDVPEFCGAVNRARSKGIPVIALKSGGSDIGAEIALSHTSTLAGSDELYSALFQRIGVARVRTLSEMIETLKLLHVAGPLSGNNISSLSCSGGDAALIADFGSQLGLKFNPIPDVQASQLQKQLGDKVSISNPFDYHTYIWGNIEEKTNCFTRVMQGGYDISLLILDYPKSDLSKAHEWDIALDAMIAAQRKSGHQAAVLATLPENLPAKARSTLIRNNVVPLQGVEDGLKAISSAAWISSRWKELTNNNVSSIVEKSSEIEGEIVLLDEAQAKSILNEYGLPIPKSETVSISEAGFVAEQIGFPVVVKAVSADLAHKTEAGGVALNLQSVADVTCAAERMAHLSDDVLVESMITDIVAEVIVGVTRDPQFGLSLVVGSGGVWVELMQDAIPLLLPVSRDDIHVALKKLKLYKLLEGYRGQPVGDIDALINTILLVADFARHNEKNLVEMDLNPVMVLPKGKGIVIADAMIRMASEERVN
ncbi:acetate--CoA ligase family protein [Kiloniella majae]|uniref:acetate--CoA ligase family protein n=1 Tax=Kiloniella majae TaxID=1938558 RepID=UPI000A278EFA|nr:acetate--CoA ligase family protein [Kiloniella majae]